MLAMTDVASPAVALAERIAEWALDVRDDDVPSDVVDASRLRLLDVVGLALAGADTPFGRATRRASVAMSAQGPSRIVGTGDRVGVTTAAFANAAFAQALEFDDTHNESIVHMSSPAVTAALALSETQPVSGRQLLTVIAIANEISCRVGSVSSGELHKRGFHPTGLFAPFGITVLTARLLGLDATALAHALGICGSFASGILECWVDGTQSKFLHSGWAAQSGIAAAMLAREGVSGPPRVLEGRFGLFASHVQDASAKKDFSRITSDLGQHWESRNSSFKPYPAAHVLHPYVDAVLRVRRERGIVPGDVERIDCPVAAFIVPIVCEPVEEKVAPATQAHGRVCLQYTIAEALMLGGLGRRAYESFADPQIRALARRVHYHVDPQYPGPGRFKGAVRITLRDGRVIDETQEHNIGSPENPMSEADLIAKFDDNASAMLSAPQRRHLADAILSLDGLEDVSELVTLSVA
jgi:2-methylcitrate dehydratase PrpD